MNEPQFFSFSHGRGSLFLLPCFRQDEWDDLKIRIDKNIPKGELRFIVNPCFGKKFWDVVTAGQGLLLGISGRVVKLLQDNNITGCKFYPITINDHEDLSYYLLTITGRCGAFDISKSKVMETIEYPESVIQNSNIVIPKGKFSIMKGFHFPLESWDGSDFFTPEGGGDIIVTERVKDLLKKHKVTNVVLENIKDMVWNSGIYPENTARGILQSE